MKNVLIVVDMVNGFINEGNLSDKNINKVTPNIVNLVKEAILKEIPIIAFKDCHLEDDEEFKLFPVHCIKGTSESDFIPELKPYENDFFIIEKNQTNGFNTENFKEIANKIIFDKAYVVGCCTDICVEQFATSYQEFNQKHNRPTQVVVLENSVYTFDNPIHNANANHKEALARMEQVGVQVLMQKPKVLEFTK